MPKWITKPAKYNNAEDMGKIISEYFEECEANKEIPSVTGLAYALNMSRQGLMNYENCLSGGNLKELNNDTKAEIVNIIKRAKHFIEYCYEQSLFNQGKTTGAIFTLKNNYGWVDKQEIVNSSSNNIENMTQDEIEKRLKELEE
ncbi:terminase small subunit [Clostridium saccharoperbutylacetonicum]